VQARFDRGYLRVDSVLVDTEVMNPLADLSLSQNTKASVSPTLAEAAATSDWVGDYGGAKERAELLARLHDDENKLREIIERIAALEKDLESWPDSISDGDKTDAAAVFDIVWRNLEVIGPHLLGETRRRVEVFSGPPPEHSADALIYEVREDKDDDYHVSSGKHNIALVWTPTSKKGFDRHKKELKECFRRLAYAIAACDAKDLKSVRSAIKVLCEQRSETVRLLELIELERKRFSRWMVRVVVVNEGKDRVTLGDKAVLYVRSAGSQIHGRDGVVRSMVANAKVLLERVRPQSLSINNIEMPAGWVPQKEPATIAGGDAATLVFESVDLIPDAHPDGLGLHDVFAMSTNDTDGRLNGVKAMVSLQLIGGNTEGASLRIDSESFWFRQATAYQGMPSADSIWGDRSESH
jgi:hypothetical protein